MPTPLFSVEHAEAGPDRLQRRGLIALSLVAFFCLCIASCAAFPGAAWAKSYAMPHVDIQADVTAGGDLHVVEQREFDFNGSFSAVWWNYDSLPYGASMQVNGVKVASSDGSARALPSVPFNTKWRDSGGPASPAYSLDSGERAIYVFDGWSDEAVTVTVDYTVVDAVAKYSDVGELYWQMVGAGWAEDSDDVSCAITLPVAAGATVAAGDNVRAWGHGPLDATVAINDDGTVSYRIPHVSSGSFAEARILFPAEWLAQVKGTDANAHPNEVRLDAVVNEEIIWSDQANRMRVLKMGSLVISILVTLAVLAWGFWQFFRYGRELKPAFTDEYWRDVPIKGVHPAVIGRLMRFDKEASSDFTVTIMNLISQGAIRVEKGRYSSGGMAVEEYFLTRIPAVELSLNSRIDRRAMELLFDVVGAGRSQIWLSELNAYAQANPEKYTEAMASWQGVVTAYTMEQDFFETYSKSKKTLTIAVGLCLIAVCFIIGALFENLFAVIPGVIGGVVLFVVGGFMERRTQKGADDYARAMALKHWLQDFTALGERPVLDVKVWGVFMVYAYLFGVADKVIEELRSVAPELFVANDEASRYDTYVPWWVVYHSGSWGDTVGFGASLGSAVSSSIAESAQAIASAASGDFSSGFGGGGGFSGGGGGGFGGGGGAR